MPPLEDRQQGRSQLFTFSATPKPEFWFGERVDFFWNDEDSGDRHSETGEIVGVAWNFLEQEWQYIVIWLSSTADPDGNYPIFDGNFVTAEVICKH
jgi:hypothetical protein